MTTKPIIAHICPKCLTPWRVEPQVKWVKENGEWVGRPGVDLCTCDNPDCPREGITLNPDALRNLTDEQAARYPRKGIRSC